MATAALLVKAKDKVNVVEDNTLEPGEIFDSADTEDSGDDSGAPPAKKAKKDSLVLADALFFLDAV